MKVLGLIGAIVLLTACNNTAPTATGYKQQLSTGAVGGANSSGNGTAAAGAGNATKGQTLFASCAGCHAKGAANEFAAAVTVDATAQAKSPVHGGFAASFSGQNALDITAYIKTLFPDAAGGGAAGAGDAAKGEALLTGASCGGCHPSIAPLDQFADLDAQIDAASTTHAAALKKIMTDNKADIQAALKARTQ